MDETIAKVMDAISKEDTHRLRELASEFSDDAAIRQDETTVDLAIITYCFNKIFGKIHFREKTEEIVDLALKHLSQGEISRVIEEIHAFDFEHGLFHGGLVGKAKIKIGTRLYSRGLSISHSSEITGAPVSELLEYAGDTKHHEEVEKIPLSDRLNITRDLFKNDK